MGQWRKGMLPLLAGVSGISLACGQEGVGSRVSVRLQTPKSPVKSGQVGPLVYCDRSIQAASLPGLGGIALTDRFQNAPESFWFEKYSLSGQFVDAVPLQMGQAFQLRKGGPRTLEVTGFAQSCDLSPVFYPVVGTKRDFFLDKPGDVTLDVWVSSGALTVTSAQPGGPIPAELVALKLPGIGANFNGGNVTKAKIWVSGEERVPSGKGVAPWGYALISSLTAVPIQSAHWLGPVFPGRKYELRWQPLTSTGGVVSGVKSVCLQIDLVNQSGGSSVDLTGLSWSSCP